MYNIYLHIFLIEQQVVATGMFYGHDAYFTSGWNIMDGSLVTISIIDLLMSLISESSPRIFGILRVSTGSRPLETLLSESSSSSQQSSVDQKTRQPVKQANLKRLPTSRPRSTRTAITKNHAQNRPRPFTWLLGCALGSKKKKKTTAKPLIAIYS